MTSFLEHLSLRTGQVLSSICSVEITQIIKRTFGPCGKYGSRPSNGTTLGRYIHRRQFKGRVLRPYWKTTLYKGLRQFHEQTLSYLYIQHRSITRRWIYRVRTSLHFSLIQRCAGHTMTDVKRPKARLIVWVICFWHRPP
jgi:hypothetical protein